MINTVMNLMANTKFTKKKNKAPISLLNVLELLAEMSLQCKSIMNFLSDELLFEKSQKLLKLRITKSAFERNFELVELKSDLLI